MKIIGLSSSLTENRTYCNSAYHTAFNREGVTSVALPILPAPNRETLTAEEYAARHGARIDALVSRLDAVVCTGGVDISPMTFGDRNWGSTSFDMERDFMELALVRAAIAAGKPIMGICKGFQLINREIGVPFFTQDLGASEVKESHNGAEYELKDRAEPAHSIYIYGEFLDYVRHQTGRHDLTEMRVPSFHHQGFLVSADGKLVKKWGNTNTERRAYAINEIEIAADIRVLGSTNAVIELVEKPAIRYVGTQGHQEEIPNSLIIDYWLQRYVLNA